MSRSLTPFAWVLALVSLAAVPLLPVRAQEGPAAQPTVQPPPAPPAPTVEEVRQVIYERVHVVGSSELAAEIPGSAHYLDATTLGQQGHTDVHRMLRRVPGVNVQEEEGFGLRPNIGIRGTGVERSQKITLMEDGVLIAPAPYTAPAAYYFPTAGRMQGIEVRKGSAAVRQGPYTNGGAINLISQAIPADFGGRVNAAIGEFETRRLHAYLGDSSTRFGWLVETFQLDSDGFKQLDGGGDTGVDLQDYLVKLHVNSSPLAERFQYLELKLGRTEQFGHETYLGLTAADFERTPYRRYAASAADTIDTEHEQVQLRHFVQLTPHLDLTTTAYHNDFYRDWFKNESVRGVSNGSVLARPELFAHELAILRGERDSAAGDLVLRHNRRDYYARGLESVLALALQRGRTRHAFQLGVRFHQDEEDRLQADDRYQMLGGELVLSSRGVPGSHTNRVSDAEALAIFLEDRISFGRWTLLPGVRVEDVDYRRADYALTDPDRNLGPTRVRRNGVRAVLPGLGADVALSDADHLFLGLHQGFSPPGAGATVETREEESLNYELGWRHHQGRLRFEAIAFYSDYDNLLGRETVSGGGSTDGELFNGGQVEVRGLELALETRLHAGRFAVPLHAAYTFTAAEFRSSFATEFEDWGPQVTAGDALPYLPPHQLAAGAGLAGESWAVYLDASYVSPTRAAAGSGPIPDAQRIDSRVVLDLSAEYTLLAHTKLYAQLRNVTDEVYLVARRPYGVRPGLPRSLLAGVSFTF